MKYRFVKMSTDLALGYHSNPFRIPIEWATAKDERIMSEFFIEERSLNPNVSKYANWPVLIGDEKNLVEPLKNLVEKREKLPEALRGIEELLEDKSFIRFGLNKKIAGTFGELSTMMYTAFDWKVKFYESVLAFSKGLGEKMGKEPEAVVADLVNRNAIYMMVFHSSQNMNFYNAVNFHAYRLNLETVARTYRDVEEVFEEKVVKPFDDLSFAERIIAGMFLSLNPKAKEGLEMLKEKRKQMPPEDVRIAFYKDESERLLKRSRDIFE